MRRISLTVFALLLLCGLAGAKDVDPEPSVPKVDESGMEVILVMGEQPGPGLWKVSSGPHVMWILGEISPFPRQVKWKSTKFDGLLRESQELLLDFSGYWRTDAHQSAALENAGKLPAGQDLDDVISPQLYSRVQDTAKLFGGPSLDDLHPFAATNHLVTSALRKLDMSRFSARFAAAELGRKRHVRITYYAVPEIAFEERLRNWRHPSNVVCLERLVNTLDDGGSGVRRLANAWSTGDIAALRELVPAYSFSRDGFRADECAAAMHGGEQQSRNYKTSRTQGWLNEAERALHDNRSTMAVVLMSEIFAEDGYLAALRDKGYEITAPE